MKPLPFGEFKEMLERGPDPNRISLPADRVSAAFDDLRKHSHTDLDLLAKTLELWRWAVTVEEFRRGEFVRNRILNFAFSQWQTLLKERQALDRNNREAFDQIAELRNMILGRSQPSIFKE